MPLSVLHNHIWRLHSIIESLFLFMLPTFSLKPVLYSSMAEHYFVSFFYNISRPTVMTM